MTGNRGQQTTEEETMGFPKRKQKQKSMQSPQECSLIQTAQLSRAVIPKWLCCRMISGHYLLDKYWGWGRRGELFLYLLHKRICQKRSAILHEACLPLPPTLSLAGSLFEMTAVGKKENVFKCGRAEAAEDTTDC